MRSGILFFFCLIAWANAGFSTRSIGSMEPVLGLEMNFKGDQNIIESWKRDQENQPFPEQLQIKFQALGKQFDFELSKLKDFTAGSKVIVYGEDNKIIQEYVPQNTVYRAELPNGWINLNVHQDGLFHSILNYEGELYTLDPLTAHEEEMDSKTKREISGLSNMVIYKDQELLNQDGFLCGVADSKKRSESAETSMNATFYPREKAGRDLLAVGKWVGCYPNDMVARKFSVGFAVDYGYFLKYKTEALVRQSVMDILSNSNVIYHTQLNVFLALGTLTIRSAAGGEAWNRAPPCGTTIQTQLNDFTAWRRALTTNTDGIHQLLTDCYPPPGTVGLAWVGVLCSKSNGCGVNTYTSTSTWKTVAHEVGHNFGASHSFQEGQGKTGGIMDYGDGKLNGEYQFHTTYNKNEVCSHISSSMNSVSSNLIQNCWGSYEPKCGNGIVEQYEDCDVQNACCQNCRFAPGAVCASGECCQNCGFAPSSKKCGTNSFCSNGVCASSICAQYSNLIFCGVSESNTCQQTCAMTDNPATCYNLNSFRLNGALPDGTICAANSVCKAGACVYGNPPTSAPTTRPTLAPTTRPPTTGPTLAPTTRPPTTVPTTRPPTTRPPTYVPTPSWVVGVWSKCTAACGGGTQTRSVSCSLNGQFYQDSSCAGVKPTSTQPCNTFSCTTITYVWVILTYPCNAACGQTGTRPIVVRCSPQSDTSVTVADSNCRGTKPTPVPPTCAGPACGGGNYGWLVGPWSGCSPRCGRGTRTRQVVCPVGDDSVCNNAYGTKPTTSEVCFGPACSIQWQITENTWGNCSEECGPGVQTRAVECFDGNNVVDSSLCSSLTSPTVESRPCFMATCENATGPNWVATETWTNCNVACGQQGLQTRIWVCSDENGILIEEENCEGGMPQNINRPCYVPCGVVDEPTIEVATDAPGAEALSTGAIIGIAIGATVAVLIVAAVAGYFVMSKKKVYRGKAPTVSTNELTPSAGQGSNPLYASHD